MWSPNLWQDKKYSGVPSSCGNQEEEFFFFTCIKQSKTKKKFFTFELVVMVGSATNRLCQFWQYACVYECVNVHLETWTDNTQTCPHIHTHTENNGWKKSVKATSSDSQGNTTGSGVTCGQLGCGHLLPDLDGLLRAAWVHHPPPQTLSPPRGVLNMLPWG